MQISMLSLQQHIENLCGVEYKQTRQHVGHWFSIHIPV